MYEKYLLQKMKALSDQESIELFLSLGLRGELSRKQYYGRLSKLMKAGLLKRVSKKNYEMTSTGYIVKKCLDTISDAISMEPKLRAFDILKNENQIPTDDLIDQLFDSHGDEKIRDLLRATVGAGVSND